jgi:pimeloyl-ACP methyl ester carboxylesterase
VDILFCHGLESEPHGRKYQALREAGIEVVAPDFRGLNLSERVAILEPLLAEANQPIVVGSSYGGITALCAALRLQQAGTSHVEALVLCAPALGRSEPPADQMKLVAPCPTVIIHGTHDDIVPIAISRDFRDRNRQVELVEVDDGHRLKGSLDLIVERTKRFMQQLTSSGTCSVSS